MVKYIMMLCFIEGSIIFFDGIYAGNGASCCASKSTSEVTRLDFMDEMIEIVQDPELYDRRAARCKIFATLSYSNNDHNTYCKYALYRVLICDDPEIAAQSHQTNYLCTALIWALRHTVFNIIAQSELAQRSWLQALHHIVSSIRHHRVLLANHLSHKDLNCKLAKCDKALVTFQKYMDEFQDLFKYYSGPQRVVAATALPQFYDEQSSDH